MGYLWGSSNIRIWKFYASVDHNSGGVPYVGGGGWALGRCDPHGCLRARQLPFYFRVCLSNFSTLFPPISRLRYIV
jgi:hypothetical protein